MAVAESPSVAQRYGLAGLAAALALAVGYAGAVLTRVAGRADLDLLARVLFPLPALGVLMVFAVVVSFRYPRPVPSVAGALVPYLALAALLGPEFGVRAFLWPSAWLAGSCGLPLMPCPGSG